MGVCTTPEGLPTLPLGRAIGETLGETFGNNLNFLVNLQIGRGVHQGFEYAHITGNVAYPLRGLFAYWRDLFRPQRPL